MALAVQKFIAGQMVYSKIKGYPPWPSVVTHMPSEKMARVQYFNWNGQWNELSIRKLTPFHAGGYIEKQYLDKNVAFTKAFYEMLAVMEAFRKNKMKENEMEEKETKKKKENPRRISPRLKPSEIKEIRSEFKPKGAKSRLRSGRLY